MISPLVGSDRYFAKNDAPILFKKAKNYTVTDQNGNQYIDFILGLGPVILGHSDEEFVRRISEQLSNGLSFPGFADVHTELAKVYEAQYQDMRVVTLFKTSSEAVTAAMRCAMLETGRSKFIRCGFLGWHDSQIANTPSWHEWPGSEKREALRFSQGMRGIDGEQGVFNWTDGDITSLEALLSEHGDTTAAFAIDVYQLAFMTMETLQQATALCRQYGVKIIIDETKTAGRTNPAGMLDTQAIPADYIILGKAVGNGLPLAVLLGKPEHIKIYQSARIGGTHTKEVLSAHAGIIVADIMQQREGYARLPLICQKIVSTINAAITHSATTELLSATSLLNDTLFDLRFSDPMLNNFAAREQLKQTMIAEGIFMLQGHNSFVCLAHEQIDFSQLEDTLTTALRNWSTQL